MNEQQPAYVVVIFTGENHGSGCTLSRCPMEAFPVNSREEAEPIMEKYAWYDPHFLRVVDPW